MIPVSVFSRPPRVNSIKFPFQLYLCFDAGTCEFHYLRQSKVICSFQRVTGSIHQNGYKIGQVYHNVKMSTFKTFCWLLPNAAQFDHTFTFEIQIKIHGIELWWSLDRDEQWQLFEVVYNIFPDSSECALHSQCHWMIKCCQDRGYWWIDSFLLST